MESKESVYTMLRLFTHLEQCCVESADPLGDQGYIIIYRRSFSWTAFMNARPA